MAKSLAFWLEGNKNQQTSIELHFNYWLLNMKTDQEINYLDVGVKFRSLDDIKSINFFFPFRVNKENYIHDLGLRLHRNRELIPAIFNARIESESPLTSNILDIKFANNDDKLRLFCEIELAKNDNDRGVKLTNLDSDGTILSFPSDLFNRLDTSYGYFRFRISISPEDKNCISQIYVPKDTKLLSRMESTEIVDFRLNEIRDLPAKIITLLDNSACITTVHFFLIRETNSELKLSHAEFKRCRILEKELWDSYLKDSSHEEKFKTPDQMLIYHWKEPKDSKSSEESKELSAEQSKISYLEKFSAFAKFSTIAATRDTLRTFMIYIVVLGIISGVLANFVFSYFQQDSDTRNQIFFNGVFSGVISTFLLIFFYSIYKSDSRKNSIIIPLSVVLILLGALANSYFSVLELDSSLQSSASTQLYIGGICSGVIFSALFNFFYSLYELDSITKNTKISTLISCIMCIVLGGFFNSFYVWKPTSNKVDAKSDIDAALEQTSGKATEHDATFKKKI